MHGVFARLQKKAAEAYQSDHDWHELTPYEKSCMAGHEFYLKLLLAGEIKEKELPVKNVKD